MRPIFRYVLYALISVILIELLHSCSRETTPDYYTIYFNNNLQYSTIEDVDGNSYRTIQLGDQIWMAENLRVKHYRDGTEINLITNNDEWIGLTSEAYGIYENNYKLFPLFGCLYNYYSTKSDHELCPAGWHVPTVEDWTELGIFLGGESLAGDKLKEQGPAHWGPLNTGTNESGFTALPGGMRSHLGTFYSAGDGTGGAGYWWASTESSDTTAWSYSLGCEAIYVFKTPFTLMRHGFSVRCIKD